MSGPIRPIRYTEVFAAPNAPSLFDEYARECSLPQVGQPVPQPEMYEPLERAGLLHCLGAYVGEELVGYAFLLCNSFPHYREKVATVESLFVASEHREHGLGMKLMDAIEDCAVEQGCVAVFYSAPVGGQLERLLHLLKDYEQTNTIFCRRLA